MVQLSVQLDRLEVNYTSDELTEKNLTKLRPQKYHKPSLGLMHAKTTELVAWQLNLDFQLYIYVTARFKTWPVLKPAARFKTGQSVLKSVDPV